ncbi:MBL fold metallo-hydrolase [Clostridiaceae bacterium OttesenSCG-928-D20]|nr:MBL fold metallo-hydrolase [Clostridiaceae bacterium OttesenSCG-928-D20]
MLIKTLEVGHIITNCYIVTDENTLECAVIDPGDESGTILDYLEDNKLKCKYIFITHGHYDHTMAASAVSEETGAVICMNEKDSEASMNSAPFRFTPPEGSIFYKEGDSFQVGGLTFKILETPGHSPGGVTIICENALFTGDTLFRDSCGRADLPGGDMDVQLKSLKKLSDLEGDFEVYPGHMESTTLDRERRFNFYVKQANQAI